MVTTVSQTYEFRGLSTDDKSKIKNPGNGSVFREMDTGKVYLYNGDDIEWVDVTDTYGPKKGGGNSIKVALSVAESPSVHLIQEVKTINQIGVNFNVN